jgi:hypothetical protein
MKYQIGDLVKWDDDVIDFYKKKNEHYMIITDYVSKRTMNGVYVYRYIDTGRKDSRFVYLLDPKTSKVG